MNWTVKGTSNLRKEDVELADEVCEHLQVGHSAFYVGEQDSFGPVTRFWYCKTCYRKYLEEEKRRILESDDDPESNWSL